MAEMQSIRRTFNKNYEMGIFDHVQIIVLVGWYVDFRTVVSATLLIKVLNTDRRWREWTRLLIVLLSDRKIF